MSYTLGQKYTNTTGEQEAIVVAIRADKNSEWQIQEGVEEELKAFLGRVAPYRKVVLLAEGEYDEAYITEEQLDYYDEWSDSENWTGLMTVEEAVKQKEVSDKIIAILKEHNIETSDLIVSDGRAYVGYAACANFIETTGSWVPSSMQC